MPDSSLPPQPETTPGRLGQYASLVQKYSGTLDLSSPDAIKNFNNNIAHTEPYDNFLSPRIRVLDIGSGVGLPAIPIAIRRPDLDIVLCEIRKRRAAFLELAVSSLRLGNARVYNGDVQQLIAAPFDAVVAQAIGRISRIYSLCHHLLKPSWRILTRKGAALEAEIDELSQMVQIFAVERHQLEDGTAVVAITGGET